MNTTTSCRHCGRHLRHESYCPHCGTLANDNPEQTEGLFCSCCGHPREHGKSATAAEWAQWSDAAVTAVAALPDLAFLAFWVDGGGERPENDGASYQVEARRFGDQLELRAAGSSQLLPGLRYPQGSLPDWRDPEEPGRRLRWGPADFDDSGIEEAVAAVTRLLRGPFQAQAPRDIFFESSAETVLGLLDPTQCLATTELGVQVLEENLVSLPDVDSLLAELGSGGGRMLSRSADGAVFLRGHDGANETVTVQFRPTRSLSIAWPAFPVDHRPTPGDIAASLASNAEALGGVDPALQLVQEVRAGGLIFDGIALVRPIADREDLAEVLGELVANADQYLDESTLASMGASRSSRP